MNITVIGTGYVGITTAASLGELGHHIIGVDIDEWKIEQLQKGILPIYEPGVEPVIRKLLEQGSHPFRHLGNIHCQSITQPRNFVDKCNFRCQKAIGSILDHFCISRACYKLGSIDFLIQFAHEIRCCR